MICPSNRYWNRRPSTTIVRSRFAKNLNTLLRRTELFSRWLPTLANGKPAFFSSKRTRQEPSPCTMSSGGVLPGAGDAIVLKFRLTESVVERLMPGVGDELRYRSSAVFS